MCVKAARGSALGEGDVDWWICHVMIGWVFTYVSVVLHVISGDFGGLQRSVVVGPEPWGLGINESILPQYLKDVGDATHAVGKVGFKDFKQ